MTNAFSSPTLPVDHTVGGAYDGCMDTFMMNALAVVGQEATSFGAHWPKVQQSFATTSMMWSRYRKGGIPVDDIKRQMLLQLSDLEGVVAELPIEQQAEMSQRVSALRNAYALFFEKVSEHMIEERVSEAALESAPIMTMHGSAPNAPTPIEEGA